MPRGRPRKNPLPNEANTKSNTKASTKANPPDDVEDISTDNNSKAKKEDKSQYCERCHNKLVFSERKINLTYLTCMATWHRDVNVDKVSLCYDCCKELNKLIDDWLLNKGKGVQSKYNKQV